MWLLASELVSRLTSYFNVRKQTDFKASFDGQLPLQEYYDAIDAHFEVRVCVYIKDQVCLYMYIKSNAKRSSLKYIFQ